MEILELKKQIFKEIDLENDIERLEDCYRWLVSPDNSYLTSAEIYEMEDMAKNPSNYEWSNHEDAVKRIAEWRKK